MAWREKKVEKKTGELGLGRKDFVRWWRVHACSRPASFTINLLSLINYLKKGERARAVLASRRYPVGVGKHGHVWFVSYIKLLAMLKSK